MPPKYWRHLKDAPLVEVPLSGDHNVRVQTYLDGADGGPEACRSRFSAGFESPPHFHKGAQFQVLLSGALIFPDETLHAPGVHYTDHNVGYGPFEAGEGNEFLILHAKPAGAVLLDSPARFKEVNKTGRELIASGEGMDWSPVPGLPGAEQKTLIAPEAGPSALLVRYAPAMEAPVAPTTYGRYLVVYEGALHSPFGALEERGIVFCPPGEEMPALWAGPEGVTLIMVEFDENSAASYGGSNFDAIDLAAQEIARTAADAESAAPVDALAEAGDEEPGFRYIRLGACEEIVDGRGKAYVADGRKIAVFRSGARYFATINRCPHKAGPLSMGFIAGSVVTCPLHGWEIDLATGRVVHDPSICTTSFEVRVEDGELIVRLPAVPAA